MSWFGGFTGSGFLAYAVRGVLRERRAALLGRASRRRGRGGGRGSARRADVGHAGGPVWRVRASSEGTWGDELTFTLRETQPGTDRRDRPTIPTARSPRCQREPVSAGARMCGVSRRAPPVPVWKVVAAVDPHRGRVLLGRIPRPAPACRYDGPLHGLDLGAPIVISSVEYRADSSARPAG